MIDKDDEALPNRFGSISEVALGSVVWANARGFWRRSRVIRKGRTRVTVRYFIQDGATLRDSLSCLAQLRRHEPDSRYRISTPAPELGR